LLAGNIIKAHLTLPPRLSNIRLSRLQPR